MEIRLFRRELEPAFRPGFVAEKGSMQPTCADIIGIHLYVCVYVCIDR